MSNTLWKYSLAGLLVLVPAWATFLILSTLFLALNELIHDLPWNIGARQRPGLILVLFLLLVVIVGAIATHVVGRRIITQAERWIGHIPLVRSVYITLKGMTDLLNFRSRFGRSTVVAFPFPRDGLWAIGFVMGLHRRRCKSHQQQVCSWSLCPRPSIRSPDYSRLSPSHRYVRSICHRKMPSRWSVPPVCTSRKPDGYKPQRQRPEPHASPRPSECPTRQARRCGDDRVVQCSHGSGNRRTPPRSRPLVMTGPLPSLNLPTVDFSWSPNWNRPTIASCWGS